MRMSSEGKQTKRRKRKRRKISRCFVASHFLPTELKSAVRNKTKHLTGRLDKNTEAKVMHKLLPVR